MTTTLDFPKRGRRADTAAGPRTVWVSRCRRYRLERSQVAGYAPVFRALALDREGRWWYAGRQSYRTRAAALRALAAHAREAAE
jgi:hypothetical protein